jgi:general secretion pathway protein A
MYMERYGLREQPFGVTPNPRFLYFSAMHKGAITSLVNSVCERRGFSALIAKPGMGKTTLLMQLLAMLRDSARTGFLFQTHGNSREFLSALLQDIDTPPASLDMVDMQKALNAAVVREARENRQLVIVVDEAQNLSDDTLESIRLLSNFENPEAKLLHIIFAGQPPLAEKLASPQLAQLRQRISVVAHLTPLNREQVSEFISRRLEVAGYSGKPLFTDEAIDFVAQKSEGIPRNINNLCFHALSLGHANHKAALDLATVQLAARALDLKHGPQFHVPSAAHMPPPHVNRAMDQQPAQVPAGRWERLDPLTPPRPRAREWKSSKKPRGTFKVGVGAFAGIALLAVMFHGGLEEQISAYLPHKTPLSAPSIANNAEEVASRPNPPVATPVAPPAAPVSSGPENAPASTADVPAPSEVTRPDTTVQPVAQSLPAQISAAEATRIVRTERKEDVEQLTRQYFGAHTGDVLPVVLRLNPGIASPPVALPAGTPVMIPAESMTSIGKKRERQVTQKAKTHGAMPKRTVRLARMETIFQFAMEHYGKADIGTVDKIRAANPQIKDIYQTLREGQSMTLPATLEAEQ